MPRLELFQQFLREGTYINNVTVSTREWYECAWKAFTAAQKIAPERDRAATLITKSDLQQFIVHFRERGVKPVTCNTWLRAMNAFCRQAISGSETAGTTGASGRLADRRLGGGSAGT